MKNKISNFIKFIKDYDLDNYFFKIKSFLNSNRSLIKVITAFFTITFFYFIFKKINVIDFLTTLKSLTFQFKFFIWFLICYILQTFLLGYKWKLMISTYDKSKNIFFKDCLIITLQTAFYNLIVQVGFLAKIYLTKLKFEKIKPISIFKQRVIEKIYTIFIQIIFFLISYFLISFFFEIETLKLGNAIITTLFLILFSFLSIIIFYLKIFRSILQIQLIGITFIFEILSIVGVMLIILTLNFDFNFLLAFFLIPTIRILEAIPVSYLKIGQREIIYIIVLKFCGLSLEEAMICSLYAGFINIFNVCFLFLFTKLNESYI